MCSSDLSSLAFDGANMWCANFGQSGGGNVVKWSTIRSGISATVTLSAQSWPSALAFDGTDIWVGDRLRQSTDAGYRAAVYRINAASNQVVAKIQDYADQDPAALAFDGMDMWIATGGPNALTKLRP